MDGTLSASFGEVDVELDTEVESFLIGGSLKSLCSGFWSYSEPNGAVSIEWIIGNCGLALIDEGFESAPMGGKISLVDDGAVEANAGLT